MQLKASDLNSNENKHCFLNALFLPSPGRDGGAEVGDAGNEGHVHGGRCLPAAGTAPTTGAGKSKLESWLSFPLLSWLES